MTDDLRTNLAALSRAALETRDVSATRHSPVSASVQKSALFVLALNGSAPMPAHRLAAMLGVSVNGAGDTLIVLQDQRLIRRVDCWRPAGWRGPCNGYEIEWAAVHDLGRVPLRVRKGAVRSTRRRATA